jgi:N-carbamoyl-L-amino-acid hydrolase
VEKITGITWIQLTILGQENHAGTTPMTTRKDALVAASEIVSFVSMRTNEIVEKIDSSTVGTVGRLNVFPNGINIIPGKVEMGIDIRDVIPKNMDDLKGEIMQMVKKVETKYGIVITAESAFSHKPTTLSSEIISVIDGSARQVDIKTMRINSGAGHDAQNMAAKVKTGMIFVPSINGISHSPMEWTNWWDIEKGVKVLTQTLKNLLV